MCSHLKRNLLRLNLESFVEVGIFLIIMVSTQCLSESMVRGLQRTEDLAAQARKDQKGI